MIPITTTGAEPKALSPSLTIIPVTKTSHRKNSSKEDMTIMARLMLPVWLPANLTDMTKITRDYLSSVPNSASHPHNLPLNLSLTAHTFLNHSASLAIFPYLPTLASFAKSPETLKDGRKSVTCDLLQRELILPPNLT
jgi:hypothetical protein